LTPQQFLTGLKQGEPAPVYLFLGPEPYQREYCRRALLERVLPSAGEREAGLTRHDLEETTLAAVLEDACSLSLFAPRRAILVSNAEAALPRGRGAEEPEDGEGAAPAKGSAAALAEYVRNPVAGVVIVLEAARHDFQGEDKRKLERVRKFYSAAPATVEFPQMGAQQARLFAENLARKAGLKVGAAELDLLVEALGGEAARIAAEIEKLGVYAAAGKPIGVEEIAALVPEARGATIFSLVAALGRNDRVAALGVLDTLIRQSEYLPLALSFLGTQFRLALAAKEAGLKSPQQIQAHFSRQGMSIWGSRAEQVFQTVSSFSQRKLAAALTTIHSADKALREARPDDRVVMEEFILRLTA
jgi:DNA polymerase-3 subunit delta